MSYRNFIGLVGIFYCVAFCWAYLFNLNVATLVFWGIFWITTILKQISYDLQRNERN